MRDMTVNGVMIELNEGMLRKSGEGLENLGGLLKKLLKACDGVCGGMADRMGLDIDKVADEMEMFFFEGKAAYDILADMLKEAEDDG